MKRQFYHQLIELETIHVSLGELDLSPEEKEELLGLVDDHIHHTVLDTMLSELTEDDKKLFLSYVTQERHDDTWKLLKEKVANSEKKIVKAVKSLKRELHEDINKARIS